VKPYIGIIAALQLVLCVSARAELPKPTCDEYRNGYSAIVQSPVSLEDDSFVRIARVLAENHLFVNPERTAYASAEMILEDVSTLSTEDALIWVYKQYDHLERRMRAAKCDFEHKDVRLMLPRLPENKHKSPAELLRLHLRD
jgi:hypothetical protein